MLLISWLFLLPLGFAALEAIHHDDTLESFYQDWKKIRSAMDEESRESLCTLGQEDTANKIYSHFAYKSDLNYFASDLTFSCPGNQTPIESSIISDKLRELVQKNPITHADLLAAEKVVQSYCPSTDL